MCLKSWCRPQAITGRSASVRDGWAYDSCLRSPRTARLLFHKIPSASDKPGTFADFPFSHLYASSPCDSEPCQQESGLFGDPQQNGMRHINLHLPVFFNRVSSPMKVKSTRSCFGTVLLSPLPLMCLRRAVFSHSLPLSKLVHASLLLKKFSVLVLHRSRISDSR